MRLKTTWRSLKTELISIAKKRLSEELALQEKREEAGGSLKPSKLKTVGDALKVRKKQIQNDVAKKSSTKEFWENIDRTIPKAWPGVTKRSLKGLTPEECEEWAGQYSKTVSASHFNHVLSALRSALEIALKENIRQHNPFSGVSQKKAVPKDLTESLPSREQFAAIVTEVRQSPNRWREACGDLVEFLAYSGLRIGEARYVLWKHCDLQRGELVVVGDPAEGTKNRKIRRVPIVPELDTLIRKMATIHQGESLDDRVLKVKSATKSLRTACTNLGMKSIQHHDLRHFFATTCIEAGVDIPTLSRWLGHQDGGVLAMKTYGHLRNEHSLAQAKKVSFT